MAKTQPTPRTRGRPRAFDREKALEAAMILFWRHGFEGVSIAQLTSAIGVAPPSLYAAFESKESLYRQAMQLYLSGLGDIGVARLNEAVTAREGVQSVLDAAAVAFTRPGYPRGCMVGVGSLRCAEENIVVAEETAALRKRSQSAFTARLKRAQAEGELARHVDIGALTDFYSSVVEGMSVQAQDGASRARLLRIGVIAMAAWPK
ncbi:MAG: TetR/AcrR family transcriptional regulator [Hyphomonadaceae bacterium]|nr:TetR/AcrR family transcriptional regulator [Hyphomonadaceae bacterium]